MSTCGGQAQKIAASVFPPSSLAKRRCSTFPRNVEWLFQCRKHVFLGENLEIRRLLEFGGEQGAQRLVEDRAPGGIGEVGEHDGVFVRDRRSRLSSGVEPAESSSSCCDHEKGYRCAEKPAARRACCHRHERSGSRRGGCNPVPPPGPGFSFRQCNAATFSISLQTFQVGADFGSVLVAQVAVLLQRFLDDLFDAGRDGCIEARR